MVSAKHPGVRLQHMLENIDGLLDATAGLQIDTILDSFILIRTTERALQIISEAAKELPLEVRATEPDIPWKDIIGIGNFLRHEYYRINAADIQAILVEGLPELRLAVLRLMERLAD